MFTRAELNIMETGKVDLDTGKELCNGQILQNMMVNGS